jgi:hypothetical protein
MSSRIVPQSEKGQAVAEFAAVLPLFLLFMMLIVEVGMVMFQQLALENAAREGARAASVSDSPQVARAAALSAGELPSDRLRVQVGPRPDGGGMVRVTTFFEARIVEPLSGTVLLRPQLHASAAMKVEQSATP